MSETINDVIVFYETGEYKSAISTGENIIAKTGAEMEKEDKINLDTYIAFSYVAIGDSLNAQKYFENILTLNANYQLNEEFVSPKIIHIFSKAKERISFLIKESPQYFVINPTIQYSRFTHSNLIMKSTIYPGWGQYDRNEKTKSIVIGAVFTTSAVFTISTFIGMLNANDRYKNAVNVEDASKYYDEYNLWSKVNRFSFDVSLSAYLFNLFDMIWSR